MLSFKFRRLNSIKFKFLAVILMLVIVFCGAIIYFWNYRTAIDASVSATKYINEMLKVSNDNLEVSLKDIYGMVNIASQENDVIAVLSKENNLSDLEQLQDSRTMRRYIAGLFTYKHYLNDITITNRTQLYSLGNTITLDYLNRQVWYPELWNSGNKPVLIAPHYNEDNPIKSPSQDDRILSIAEPVMNVDHVVGFVLADVRMRLLTDIFANNLKDQVNMFVADTTTGNLVFKPQIDSDLLAGLEQALPGIIKQGKKDSGSYYTRFGNKDYLVVYRHSPLTAWTLIGIVPKAQLLEQFYQTRNGTLLLSILFCVIAAVVTSIVTSYLTRSILRLNRAIKLIDGDNLDFQIRTQSNDEIGQLYRQVFQMVKRIKDLIENTKRTEREKRKAEIQALQSQINPHFLYNTLNTIKFLSVYQGADNIRDIVESLSLLLHINMQEGFFISVEEELEYLQSYVNIQKYKYSNKFTYTVSVEPEILHYRVPKLLLQPFLENAIIHGIGRMKGQGAILLKGFKENDSIKFRLQDNGVGMERDLVDQLLNASQADMGVGIRNVVSRMKKTFGEDYGVTIMSEPQLYTIVEVTLPTLSQEEESRYV